MSLNQRIKGLLKEHKVSQAMLAAELEVTDSAVNQLLNASKEIDSLAFITAVSKLTGIHAADVLGESFDSFFEGRKFTPNNPEGIASYEESIQRHLNDLPLVEESTEYLKGKKTRIVTATVDRSGKDLMVYVPVKAQAGYLAGHGDPHYIEKLPAFSLPILKSGQYRMFEVDGESMLQLGGGGLHDGDIVISQYVEDIFSLRDNRV